MDDQCPICNIENNCNADHCGVGCGTCWCYEIDIPEGLTKFIPTGACVCKSCVEKYNHGYLTEQTLFMKFRTDHTVKV
jgi:hypothetical protein